jgi:hypothetical protein
VLAEDDEHSGQPSTTKTAENVIKFVFVHREFVPPNTTVNSDFYCDILRRLKENVRKKTGTLVQPQLAPS